MRFWVLGAACLALGGTALGRDPVFDPRAWKAKVAGKTPLLGGVDKFSVVPA